MTDALLCEIDPWLHIASAAFVFPDSHSRLGDPYELHFSFGRLKVKRERPSHDLTQLIYEFDELIDGELKKVFTFNCSIQRGVHDTGRKYLFINVGDTRTKFVLFPHSKDRVIEYFNDATLSDVEHFLALMKLSTPSVLGLFNGAR